MNKVYERINWENEPSIATPLGASNLNKTDYAINEIDNRVIALDTGKANQVDELLDIKEISYNPTTGVWVFTHQNGTTDTFDQNIEKIPVTFSMDENGVITMTTADGTTYTCDVGTLIKTYTFVNSGNIQFTVTTDAQGNKSVTASVIDGSITRAKLDPDYLAQIDLDVASASASALAASGSATTASNKALDSEAYAIGTRNGVPVTSGDPAYENNSKYYAEHGASSLAGLTDVNISDVTNGQVIKYNSATQKWENDDESGGGIFPHLIIISETGSTVTVVKGGTTISATETSTGHYECDVPEFGTWTIHAVLNGDDATVNLVVDTVKVYTVDDSHFHGTVTVKYPTGATCRLQSTDETLYATGSPYTFTVHHAETYTITVTYNQRIYTDTVTFTTEGQSFSKTLPSSSQADANDINMWLWFGGVSGSYSSLADILADSTALATLMASTDAVDYLVRCKDWIENKGLVPVMTSATTPSGVVIYNQEESSHYGWHAFDGNTNESNFWSNASSGFPSYLGYNFGEPVKICRLDLTSRSSRPERDCKNYKIQGSNNGTDWTDIYSGTFAQQVNNTISFANDVAYSYYRLYIVDVYSGSECNIVEMQFYKFTQSIPENQSAMSYIGLNNYCANTLLADADWCEGITNSTYFESVLNVKVPTMTSDTTPSGKVSYSTQSTWNGYVHYAYKAFNGYGGAEADSWGVYKDVGGVGWVAYEFTQNVKIYKIHYKNYFTNAKPPIGTFQVYNSSTTQWEDIPAADLSAIQNTAEHDWCIPSGTRKTSKIKMNITGNGVTPDDRNWIVVDELQFYGRAAN